MNSFFPWPKNKDEGKKRSFLKFLAIVATLSIFVAFVIIFFDYFFARQNFPQNTFIGKVNVSGLTLEHAAKKLEQAPVETAFEPMVFFVTTGESFAYPPGELGLFVKSSESIEQAYLLIHKDNYLKELKARLTREKTTLPLVLDFDPPVFEEVVREIASKIESQATDSTIELDEATGKYHISQDLPGRRLDIQKTILDSRTRLKEGKNSLPLIFDFYEFPKITERYLRLAPPVYKLSGFTTYYGSHDSPNRIHNIRLIASWIDNTIMLPQEEYSLIKAIGNFSPERGFKEAYVISGDALVPEYGGGTCQIGTTLYNAVSLADLDVLLRRNHSLYFSIYPFGRDATVYPGSADFRFKNNTGNPILIKATATYKSLRFSIFGTPTGKTVEFGTPEVYSLTDHGFVHSSKWSVLKSNLPFRTVVTRKVFSKTGELIKEEKIKSYYKLYGDGTNVKIIRKEPR